MEDKSNGFEKYSYYYNEGDKNHMDYTQNYSQRYTQEDGINTDKKRLGKKKIKIEYIEGKIKRSVTFSKRKRGIMKKAFELNKLTNSDILLVIANGNGHIYTFATPRFKPILNSNQNIIQECLKNTTYSDLYDQRKMKDDAYNENYIFCGDDDLNDDEILEATSDQKNKNKYNNEEDYLKENYGYSNGRYKKYNHNVYYEPPNN